MGDTCNRVDTKGRKQGKWYILKNGIISDTLMYKDGIKVKTD
jgi:hypothetical protein